MKKILIRKGKKIKGFVGRNSDGFYYAFGRPSQDSYISFTCESIEQGIARIEMHTNEGNI